MKKESINPYKIAAIGGTLLILLQIFRIFASRLQLVDLMYPGTLATVTMSFASLIISVMLYYGYIYFGKQNNNSLMVISSILVIFSLVVSSSFTLLTFLFQKFTSTGLFNNPFLMMGRFLNFFSIFYILLGASIILSKKELGNLGLVTGIIIIIDSFLSLSYMFIFPIYPKFIQISYIMFYLFYIEKILQIFLFYFLSTKKGLH